MKSDTELLLCVLYEKCDWDLYEFLKGIPRDMGDSQCRKIAKQILEGLHFLHIHLIIHRDLKPQNILINRDQNVKITDFGLARHFSAQSSFTPVVVTLWYRSPELLLQCPYNTAVDVWAAGCIIAELYSRDPLFPGKTEVQQLNLIFQKLGTPSAEEWPRTAIVSRNHFSSFPAQSFSRITPRVPNEGRDLLIYFHVNLCTIFQAMLKFNPNQRPTCAKALKFQYFNKSDVVNNDNAENNVKL
ncbi:unnamed protein product [Dracunculus medinensis]|uniref:Protein kinase domain-containing protein n=1 Tax=Dracunculus medinensis TaxID=318479 RepID=A0A158Q3H8_DRAME|nr:unnamed protein product [Dracunculus medinensis]